MQSVLNEPESDAWTQMAPPVQDHSYGAHDHQYLAAAAPQIGKKYDVNSAGNI